ncbi:Transcriptional regulator, GntR family [Sphingomonas paucimobilis]|nr:Transcriptional regulator, GntR family [Sphingomonas paucimobilis]
MTMPIEPAPHDELNRVRSYVEQARRDQQARLPSEPQLAERLGITRPRLRRILKKLESEGLIWRHVGKGTFIGERSLTNTLGELPNMLTPLETFEARIVLEPQLAGLAALRATPAQIEEMRECLARMADMTQFADWAVWDERLHRLVAKAAHNTLLLALYDTVRESAPTGMRDRLHDVFPAPAPETNEQHEAYVDAIAARDHRRAEALMRAHLLSVRDSLFGSR